MLQCVAAGAAATRPGTVEKVDADTREVRIAHSSQVIRYQVPAGAIVIRQRRPAGLEDFAPGMRVHVRYRVGTVEPLHLYDLVDAESWPWLQRMRKEVVSGEVVSVDDKYVLFEDAKEHGRIPYRVTENTEIELGGRPEMPTALQSGMKLWIAPRLLPNGSAMATAIADSEAAVRRLRERRQPTVTGTIREWDPASRKLTLHTLAGDTRTLDVAADCLIRKDGRDTSQTALRRGITVTAHIKHSESGGDTVHRLTIKALPKAPSRKR